MNFAHLLLLGAAGARSGEAPRTEWLAGYGATTLTVDISGHAGFILLPARPRADGLKPWVWYAPVLTGRFEEARPGMFTRLLDCGFAVGGVDVGEFYDSPDGRQVFSEFYRVVVGQYGLSAQGCLLRPGRSRKPARQGGGLRCGSAGAGSSSGAL